MKLIGFLAFLLCLGTGATATSASVCSIIFDKENDLTTSPLELELTPREQKDLKTIEQRLSSVLINATADHREKLWAGNVLEALTARHNFFETLAYELFDDAVNGSDWVRNQFIQANTRALMDSNSTIALVKQILDANADSQEGVLRILKLPILSQSIEEKVFRHLMFQNIEVRQFSIYPNKPGLHSEDSGQASVLEWEEQLEANQIITLIADSEVDPSEITSNTVHFKFAPLYDFFPPEDYQQFEILEGQLHYHTSLSNFIDRIRGKTKITLWSETFMQISSDTP